MSSVSMIDGHIDETKLTDNQIIVLVNKNARYSSQYKMIADLINRQKEQINGLIAGQETLQKHLAEKNAEIERLNKRITGQKHALFEQQSYTAELQNELKTVKSEAIKEFAIGKDILKNAIYFYGMEAQLNVCIEELSELIKELCKLKRGKGGYENLAEEMADVKIILQELDIMFNNGEAVDEWINKKIERLRATLEADQQKV